MNSQTTTDSAVDLAIEITKHFESCILHPYQDPGGVWTIGWGTTYLLNGDRVTSNTPPISQEEADSFLYQKLQQAVGVVDDAVDRILSVPQTAALCEFVYNVGEGNFRASTLLQDLNDGAADSEIAVQINRWVYEKHVREGGLVARRLTEANLFTTGHLIFFDENGKVVT